MPFEQCAEQRAEQCGRALRELASPFYRAQGRTLYSAGRRPLWPCARTVTRMTEWLRNRNPCCCPWLPLPFLPGWAAWSCRRSRRTGLPGNPAWRVPSMKRPGSGSVRSSGRRASRRHPDVTPVLPVGGPDGGRFFVPSRRAATRTHDTKIDKPQKQSVAYVIFVSQSVLFESAGLPALQDL